MCHHADGRCVTTANESYQLPAGSQGLLDVRLEFAWANVADGVVLTARTVGGEQFLQQTAI
jgi:hypothetical protein